LTKRISSGQEIARGRSRLGTRPRQGKVKEIKGGFEETKKGSTSRQKRIMAFRVLEGEGGLENISAGKIARWSVQVRSLRVGLVKYLASKGNKTEGRDKAQAEFV